MKSNRRSMKSCYKVCMRKTTVRSLEPRPERVLKGRKVQKERVVPLTRPRTLKIRSRLAERERSITWKVNSRRSNPLVLMGNLRKGKKQRHGCWKSRNISRSTTIQVTWKSEWQFIILKANLVSGGRTSRSRKDSRRRIWSGQSSKDYLKNNTYPRITTKGKPRNSMS